MIGTVLLVSTLLFAFAAAFCDTQGKTRQAAVAAYLAGIAAIGAAATLFVAILGDDFSVAYVISYSSIDLPLLYKFSAFWAGQQGSFLLWLAIHACVGILLVRSGRMTAAGRSIYHLLTAMLTVLVLIKSPFVPADVIVFDGHGMNPLLQDPWMAVHPPIIFAGYALLAVPFVYSIESMIKTPMDGDFLIPMRRWTLIAWAFLGAGIFIGGYWAYKVLGWGGYWGWDPVENSSLVPWLLACVLLHLISVARERCGAFYLVHLAAIFSYAFVLYGTFLTRSGILGDFSVHSFAGSEIGLYIALANAVVLLFGLGILTVRIERLPKGAVYEQHRSRDFFVLLGMLLIVFIAAIVFFGMSMPLISGLLGESAAVDTSYYVRTSLPIAVPLVLLMALGVLLPYGSGCIARPVWIFVISVGGGILAGLVGATDILSVLLSTFALLAVAAAIEAFRRQQIGLGGMVAHVGAGLAFLAFILSGTGSQTTTVILIPDEPQEVYGHTIIYRGQMFAESGNEKSYRYEVDGVLYEAVTKLRANGEDAAPRILRHGTQFLVGVVRARDGVDGAVHIVKAVVVVGAVDTVRQVVLCIFAEIAHVAPCRANLGGVEFIAQLEVDDGLTRAGFTHDLLEPRRILKTPLEFIRDLLLHLLRGCARPCGGDDHLADGEGGVLHAAKRLIGEDAAQGTDDDEIPDERAMAQREFGEVPHFVRTFSPSRSW